MDSQTNQASGAKSQREILDEILAGLQSGDSAMQLAAIRKLESLRFSSEAIVRELKRLAIGTEGAVQKFALAALDLQTSVFVSSKLSTLEKTNRQMVLDEIGIWQEEGLVEPHRAEVLRRQYDFDLRKGIAPQTAPTPVAPLAESVPASAPTPIMETPAPSVPAPEMRPAPAPVPAAPKASLMEVLLSETSIKIYLYLGAFFVIAAAAILAALVEAARLPVLLIATALFAAGAVGLKKRLPQPSFALAIVFSFLLPIDANVLADSLHLWGQRSDIYWSTVFLLMAVIWAFGTRFYESRLFSVASFLCLSLSAVRIGDIFDASTDGKIFSVAIANLIGLLGVRFLKNWKDQKFALPVFWLTQLTQISLLLISFSSAMVNQFESGATSASWTASALTWILAASFYIASDIIIPFLFFPWMAVASLFLVPWLTLSAFDASAPVQIIGFAVWGIVHALGSEFIQRVKHPAAPKYHFPLLAWSLPLFFVAVTWGFVEDVWYGFATFLAAGIAYTLINIARPRWYVWLTALIAGLGAYFAFFALPFMERMDVFYGYRFLGAASLLLIPELFFKEKFSFTRHWNWPPVSLGVVIAGLNLLTTLVIDTSYPSRSSEGAIIMGVYAILFAAYALRLKLPLLGYFGAASAALSVVFALRHFALDWWLPALTALSVIYYLVGFLLARRDATKSWAHMLIHSGLALGILLSLTALFTSKETGGWYALVSAALFITEMYTRRNAYLEWFAEALLSIALIRILNDLRVWEFEYTLFGLSLTWLACDAVFQRTFKDRAQPVITRIATAILTLLAVFFICFEGGLTAGAIAVCFAVYTAAFAAYAWAYREPRLGYLSTASAALLTLFALDHFHIETWLPVFTGLSAGYYLAGFILRKQFTGVAQMLRYSGLALGSLLSLIAVSTLEPTGGWYAAFVGGLFVLEMYTSRNGWFEAGVHVLFSFAAFLILHDFKVNDVSYNLLAFSLIWLIGDMIFERTFTERKLAMPVRAIGNLIAGVNALILIGDGPAKEAGICFGVYAVFYAIYTWFHNKPMIGYASTSALALAVFFGLRAANQTHWLLPLIAVAVVYYVAGYFLRRADRADGWDTMLLFSGLGLGTLVALAAPGQPGGLEKAIPIAIAATFYAAEAFARKNVWLGFPANILYLIAYFVILNELKVDEPQFFTVGAAALGLLQHYLLRRAGSKRAAFITGLVSQLVLLGASYIQMVDTGELKYFFLLFFQALVVLLYGIVVRSRSLIIAPISFAVLAVVTVLYNALKDLTLVFIIGIAGIVLLALGILAVVMRERITDMAERFSDWDS